jgi:hypothetical protein
MLKPFYQSTQIVQRDTSTLWDTAKAIHVLLAATTAMNSDEVSAVITRRATFLICPALLLIAYFTPGVRVQRHQGLVCELLHGEAINNPGQALQVRIKRCAEAAVAVPPTVARDTVMRAAYPDETRLLVTNLVAIAASEAAVERFFSNLKSNVGDKRERMTSVAAVSQVLFNSSLEFIETAGGKPKPTRKRDVVSDEEEVTEVVEIPLATWQWIFDSGCAGHWAKVAETYDRADELREFFEPAVRQAAPRQTTRHQQRDITQSEAAPAARAVAAAPTSLGEQLLAEMLPARRNRDDGEEEAAEVEPDHCHECGGTHRDKQNSRMDALYRQWLTCTLCHQASAVSCLKDRSPGIEKTYQAVRDFWQCNICVRNRRAAARNAQ